MRPLSVTTCFASHLAPAALRLWHYYSEGIYGFKLDSSKAKKWLQRLKKISPQRSDDDIQKMKEELVRLIGSFSTERENSSCEQVNENQTAHPDQERPCVKMEHAPVTTPMEENPTTQEDLEKPCAKMESVNNDSGRFSPINAKFEARDVSSMIELGEADFLLAGLGVKQDLEEGRNILVLAATEDGSGKKE